MDRIAATEEGDGIRDEVRDPSHSTQDDQMDIRFLNFTCQNKNISLLRLLLKNFMIPSMPSIPCTALSPSISLVIIQSASPSIT